jgi:coenzyme F420-reducing hydrogenase alpha subunit
MDDERRPSDARPSGRPRPGDIEIDVPILARVEGEAAMHVRVADGEVVDVRLRIYEPPRFFEALLRGRSHTEPPDVTARICGICPVAYQMSACHALERLSGVTVDGAIRDLRRLLYCGEWIESHALHIGMLHAPDFLGYHGVIDMAVDHREVVESILALKKAGNELVEVLGGRPIHPVNIRLGGFYKVPAASRLQALVPTLERARDIAVDLVRWTAGFDFPELSIDDEFVSLRHPDGYPFNEGRIVSNRGLDIDASEFEDWMVEEQVPHSTALHARLVDRGRYHVGPLARYANNRDLLPGPVVDLADDVGLEPVVTNPFRSIVVRSLETLYAVEEALRLIRAHRPPTRPHVEVPPRAGEGWAATEAPRGLLYHRYRTDADGIITDAQIIPPTSQNQPTIEADVRQVVVDGLDLPRDELRHRCEQAIRNYDPCISCATHFLDLTIEEDRPAIG